MLEATAPTTPLGTPFQCARPKLTAWKRSTSRRQNDPPVRSSSTSRQNSSSAIELTAAIATTANGTTAAAGSAKGRTSPRSTILIQSRTIATPPHMNPHRVARVPRPTVIRSGTERRNRTDHPSLKIRQQYHAIAAVMQCTGHGAPRRHGKAYAITTTTACRSRQPPNAISITTDPPATRRATFGELPRTGAATTAGVRATSLAYMLQRLRELWSRSTFRQSRDCECSSPKARISPRPAHTGMPASSSFGSSTTRLPCRCI